MHSEEETNGDRQYRRRVEERKGTTHLRGGGIHGCFNGRLLEQDGRGHVQWALVHMGECVDCIVLCEKSVVCKWWGWCQATKPKDEEVRWRREKEVVRCRRRLLRKAW